MVGRGMVMARWGFLDDISCLPIKDRVSMVVSTNIKLYRPLVTNGGDKPTNCDHLIRETGKGGGVGQECLGH